MRSRKARTKDIIIQLNKKQRKKTHNKNKRTKRQKSKQERK